MKTIHCLDDVFWWKGKNRKSNIFIIYTSHHLNQHQSLLLLRFQPNIQSGNSNCVNCVCTLTSLISIFEYIYRNILMINKMRQSKVQWKLHRANKYMYSTRYVALWLLAYVLESSRLKPFFPFNWQSDCYSMKQTFRAECWKIKRRRRSASFLYWFLIICERKFSTLILIYASVFQLIKSLAENLYQINTNST